MKLGGKSHYTAIVGISNMLRGYDIQPSLILPSCIVNPQIKITSFIFNHHLPTSSLTLMLHLFEALEVSRYLALTTACHLLRDLVSDLDNHNQSHHLHTFWRRRGTLM